MDRNKTVREQAVDALLELWPNAPLLPDEAETIIDALEKAGITLLRRVEVERVQGRFVTPRILVGGVATECVECHGVSRGRDRQVRGAGRAEAAGVPPRKTLRSAADSARRNTQPARLSENGRRSK